MTEKHKEEGKLVSIADLLKSAVKLPPAQAVYSNYAYMSIQGAELYIDFYTIEPKTEDANDLFMVQKARIIIPLGIAKGLVSAIANIILTHQRDYHVELPDARGHIDADLVDTWSLLQPK